MKIDTHTILLDRKEGSGQTFNNLLNVTAADEVYAGIHERSTIMSCPHYDPSPGSFENRAWDTSFLSGWSLEFWQSTQTGNFGYKVKWNGQHRGTITFDPPAGHNRGEYSEKWIFFHHEDYLAFAFVSGSDPKTYEVRIYDLTGLRQPVETPGDIPWYEVDFPEWKVHDLQGEGFPQFDESQDGSAFFMCIITDSGRSREHAIFRTQDGHFLSYLEKIGTQSAPVVGTRGARISTNRKVQFTVGGTVVAEQALPAGRSQIQPDTVNFGTHTIGVDPRTAEVVIHNQGWDTLEVAAIADAGPFTVVSTSDDLPACIPSGDDLIVTVQFDPAAEGSFSADMAVDCIPANGDMSVHCVGKARIPAGHLVVKTSNPIDFGSVPVMFRSFQTVTLLNRGDAELPLILSIEGSGAEYFGIMTGKPYQPVVPLLHLHSHTIRSAEPNDGSTPGTGIYKFKIAFVPKRGRQEVSARLVLYGRDARQPFQGRRLPMNPRHELASLRLVGEATDLEIAQLV